MFMTNYELVYGKRKFSSNASNPPAPAEYHSTPVIQSEASVIAESSKTGFMQSAVGFMKSDDTKQKIGSLAGKLKNAAGVAAGAASGLAKSAVETAKSEETAAKLASLKEKAQSAAGGISASVSGLGNKASEAIASRKSNAVSDEIDISETDMAHTEEYLENTVQEEPIYTDDFSETSSQEDYAPDEEYEADEYIEEYEDASIETEEEIPVYNEAPKETYHSQTIYTRTHDNMDISDNSDYSKINGLYYDELVDMLKVNEIPTTTESQYSIISPDDPYYEIKQEILYSVDNEYYSGKNSYIENAPSDMVFYAQDNRSNIEIANPTVFSGPGVNYSVIEVYISNFYIVGENSNWYYVMWVDGMGAFSHACYGYIEKSNINTAPIPTVTAEIERRPVMVDFDGDGTLDFADGNDYYLNVSGDYAYYLYEYYETYPGEETLELIWSETTSEPSVYLTSGSGGFSVIVYVTPYNSDGVAGTTVICE